MIFLWKFSLSKLPILSLYVHIILIFLSLECFLGSSMVKNLLVNAGATRDVGLIPGSGRSPAGGNGNQFQYSYWDSSMNRGAWRAIACGVTKSKTLLSSWTQMHLSSLALLLYSNLLLNVLNHSCSSLISLVLKRPRRHCTFVIVYSFQLPQPLIFCQSLWSRNPSRVKLEYISSLRPSVPPYMRSFTPCSKGSLWQISRTRLCLKLFLHCGIYIRKECKLPQNGQFMMFLYFFYIPRYHLKCKVLI